MIIFTYFQFVGSVFNSFGLFKFVKTFYMIYKSDPRSIKHTFRLNKAEDQSFKANVKKSGLDKSEYIRTNILNPDDGNAKNDAKGGDGDKKPPTSKFFMSNEDRELQRKGIEGLIMAGFVIYQIIRGKGKKRN